jgi:hypothetical protein
VATTTYQRLSAGQELLTAVRLTSSGLGQLQALDDMTSDFYFLPILSLQSGLERWLKITLCFHHLFLHGCFPPSKSFPRGNRGHDLTPLLEKVAANCYTKDFLLKFDYTNEDYHFLCSDQLKRFAKALSDFGQASRYYHLNVVLGEEPPEKSPEMAWDDLVGGVMDDYPDLKEKFFETNFSDEHLMTAIRISRSVIARLGRSLARLSVLGALGDEAKCYTGYVWSFLQLSDEDLFNKDFPVFAKDI